jgi:hypothetical protein
VKVFLSGIITTPYAREFLLKCARNFRAKGFECYTPSEGGWQPAHSERTEGALKQDYEALEAADALVAVLDGFTVFDDVAAHIGTFYALTKHGQTKKGIIGILHDTRVARWDWAAGPRALNPYIRGCIEERGRVVPSVVQALGELLRWDGREGEPVRVDDIEAGLA